MDKTEDKMPGVKPSASLTSLMMDKQGEKTIDFMRVTEMAIARLVPL